MEKKEENNTEINQSFKLSVPCKFTHLIFM